MLKRFYLLLRKEYLLKIRRSESLGGLVLYGILFTVLLSFMLRRVSVRPEELGIVALPALWIIFLFTVFRYCLQSFASESKDGIFQLQLDYGFSAVEIIWAKIIGASLVSILVLVVEFLVFMILIGFPEVVNPLLRSLLVFGISIPGVLSIACLSAFMGHRSGKEEVVMPILVLPLILPLSVSVLGASESFFHGDTFDLNSFWIKNSIGISVLLCFLAGYLFKALLSIKN